MAIVTDSLSAVKAIHMARMIGQFRNKHRRPHIYKEIGPWVQQSVDLIEKFAEIETNIHIYHQKSHTEEATWQAVGNWKADIMADMARDGNLNVHDLKSQTRTW